MAQKPCETIQIRRARPSALALALALLLTIIFVYAVARPALPQAEVDAASAESPMSTQIRMEGLQVHFICHSRCSDPLQARIHAAQCISEGGAGLVLADGSGYAVIREVGDSNDENVLLRSASGLTLRLEGSAAELAAVADAVSFLRAQAVETGSLASALECGDTDASSLRALLNVYKTQGRRVLDSLNPLGSQSAIAAMRASVSDCLSRLDAAIADTTPASMRLVHASACAEWLELLEEMR